MICRPGQETAVRAQALAQGKAALDRKEHPVLSQAKAALDRRGYPVLGLGKAAQDHREHPALVPHLGRLQVVLVRRQGKTTSCWVR